MVERQRPWLSPSRLTRGVTGALALALAVSGVARAQMPEGAPGSAVAPAGLPLAAAASADYRVGSGDSLRISVYRSPDLETTAQVSEDGDIVMPTVGRVKVADLRAADIALKIGEELKNREILLNPSVSVLVTGISSKLVSVMGAVARPGDIPIDRPGLTLAEVLARSGANFGTGGGVVVVMARDNPSRREEFLISEIMSGMRNRQVAPGDLIAVQSAPTFYIAGEVSRPGAYPIEAGMTVGQAIAVGGGVTPRGTQSRIRLTRTESGGKPQELGKAKLNDVVKPNDLISVRPRLF